MEPLSYQKLAYEEFCAAATSVYQLEALERWDQIAITAFDYFEQEGNQVISVEELALVSTSVVGGTPTAIFTFKFLQLTEISNTYPAGIKFGTCCIFFTQ